MKRYTSVFVALFALILFLSMQGVARYTNGEASPVTCVVITNPVEPKVVSNYTVTVNPSSAKVIPGSTATFNVAVMSKDDVPEVIVLDITGLPDGIRANFDPVKGTTDFVSKLTITIDEMICPGIYAPSIVAKDTNMQLADFKLEVAGAGSVREEMREEISELNAKIDDLEHVIREEQSNIFAGYLALLLVAVIGSFLLGAFALFVLLRHLRAKDSAIPTGNDVKFQAIMDLLRQLVGTRKQQEIAQTAKPSEEGRFEGIAKREKDVTERGVGDVWYAYCPICALRTEHGRDYEGIFCARCGNRSTSIK